MHYTILTLQIAGGIKEDNFLSRLGFIAANWENVGSK